MTSDEKDRCRVCGLFLEEPPWGEDGQCPSFDFCPCCGAEWGYQDHTPAGARRARELWLQRGGDWEEPQKRPPDWDREKQLAAVPAAYK